MARVTNSSRVLVLLPDSLRKKVEQLAEREETTLADIGRKALRRYVEESCKAST